MGRKKVNIDLVFRNGLKDYEVLPPNESWDKIIPSVEKTTSIDRKTSRYLPFIKIAASVILVFSLGFLASRFTNMLSDKSNEDLAFSDTQLLPNDDFSSVPVIVKEADSMPIVQGTRNVSAIQKNLSVKKESVAEMPVSEAGNRASGTVDAEIKDNIENIVADSHDTYNNMEPSSNEYGKFVIPEKDKEFLLLGDSKTDKYVKNKRWAVSAVASPLFNVGMKKRISQSVAEQPVLAYTGGVAFSYKLNKRISIQSGVYYAAMGQDIKGVSTYGGFQRYNAMKGGAFEVKTANGTIQTVDPDLYIVDNISNRLTSAYNTDNFDPMKADLEKTGNSLTQNFSYIEMPLFVKYKVVDKNLDLNVIGGFSSNVLVGNSVFAESKGSSYFVGETKGLNNVLFSSSLGVGIEYAVSNSFVLSVEPTFRYYLTPFSGYGTNANPYSFGIYSGLSYKF